MIFWKIKQFLANWLFWFILVVDLLIYFGCKCSNLGMFADGNTSPEASSWANSTGCAFFLWLLQLLPFAKLFSQNGHTWKNVRSLNIRRKNPLNYNIFRLTYGLNPVCRMRWFLSAFERLNPFPQKLQRYFFWSECTTICIFNVRFVFSWSPQCGQMYAVWLWMSSWVRNLALFLNFFGQWLHLNGYLEKTYALNSK